MYKFCVSWPKDIKYFAYFLGHGCECLIFACYGNTKADAKAIDFDDSFIYDQLELPYAERSIRCEHFMRDEALAAFRKWEAKDDKVRY